MTKSKKESELVLVSQRERQAAAAALGFALGVCGSFSSITFLSFAGIPEPQGLFGTLIDPSVLTSSLTILSTLLPSPPNTHTN